jgi:ribosomal protein S18 acetylase RimI-like enzyme
MIRKATLLDLEALLALEDRSFDTDRLSRRSFRHLLTKANATTVLDERDGELAGYATVLFNAGTSLARLYSIAVDERFKGQGIGRVLVEAAEQAALDGECVVMRLEVRRDNPALTVRVLDICQLNPYLPARENYRKYTGGVLGEYFELAETGYQGRGHSRVA